MASQRLGGFQVRGPVLLDSSGRNGLEELVVSFWNKDKCKTHRRWRDSMANEER